MLRVLYDNELKETLTESGLAVDPELDCVAFKEYSEINEFVGFDLVIFNVNDPVDLFDFLYQQKEKKGNALYIAVSNELEEFVCVELYKNGINDIIFKPIGNRLFGIKIRENLSRIRCCEEVLSDCGIGDFAMMKDSYQIRTAKGNIKLSKREFQVLEVLYNNQDKIHSREELKELIWNDQNIHDRTIDVYIQKLRSHLGNLRIQTVSGKGYKLSK